MGGYWLADFLGPGVCCLFRTWVRVFSVTEVEYHCSVLSVFSLSCMLLFYICVLVGMLPDLNEEWSAHGLWSSAASTAVYMHLLWWLMKPNKLGHTDLVFGSWSEFASVGLCMQYYKSLCAAVMIRATLVNTRTQLLTGYAVWSSISAKHRIYLLSLTLQHMQYKTCFGCHILAASVM